MKYICSLILFFVSASCFAQELSEQTKQKRVEYLGRKLSIDNSKAKSYTSIIQESTNAANRVYRDSSLTDSVKRVRLNLIYKEKQEKIKLLFPDQSVLRQKRFRKTVKSKS